MSPDSSPTHPPENEDEQKRDRREINKPVRDAINGHALSVVSARVRELLAVAKDLFVAATCLPLPGRATRVLEVAFPHIHSITFSIVAIQTRKI